ncbi:MAG: GAF domain-containing sensor histidine kinase [Candidatus Promineifilaceae bacterium]|nr:GAF domain-containing sensor histidine kinase [Candidatus Promineifilaceae bacterium]
MQLTEHLLEQIPGGIAIYDDDLRLYRYNSAWAAFVDRLCRDKDQPLSRAPREKQPHGENQAGQNASSPWTGLHLYDLLSALEGGDRRIIRRRYLELRDKVRAGETVALRAHTFGDGASDSYWDILGIPLFDQPEAHLQGGLMLVINDVTDRVHARRVQEALERRADEIHTLFTVQQAITARLNRDSVLQMIADEARRLTQTEMSAVYLCVGDELEIAVVSGVEADNGLRGYRFPREGSVAGLAVSHGRSYLVEDAATAVTIHRELAQRAGVRSFAIAPLMAGEEAVGAIVVADQEAGTVGSDEQRILTLLASGAAIALENARLYERAQEAAAAEERTRLARELHDAVSQSLFSANLIAGVIPRLWEKDEALARERLGELQELTQNAAAEMRTLLLELRPAALAEAGLEELIRQLVRGSRARARLPINLALDCTRPLPPEVQVALYRIVQESLNNIVKHAAAGEAEVHLHCEADGVVLTISDNGRGFDVDAATRPGSLGLTIMNERAARIGAILTIESEPGAGTTITVRWAEPEPEANGER